MRKTKQKQFVLEFIKNSKEHPSIKQIEQYAKQNNVEVGTTTIYRILHNLSQNSLVKKIVTKDNITRFDYAHNDHIHLVCNECSKIVDVPYNQFLNKDIQSEYEFSISPQDITLYGLCKVCEQQKKPSLKYKNN